MISELKRWINLILQWLKIVCGVCVFNLKKITWQKFLEWFHKFIPVQTRAQDGQTYGVILTKLMQWCYNVVRDAVTPLLTPTTSRGKKQIM